MANRFYKDIPADLLTLTFLFIAVTIFSGEMAWGGKVPFFRDLNHYFYPLRYSLSTAFQAAEVPLWNRHMGMGFPLLADIQMGLFYPPHWLLRILPLFDAVRAIYLLHYFIAVGGAYLLWRYWEYPPYQAAVGALVFALGGTMVSLLNLLNHFQSAAWLPWSALIWQIS